MKISKLVSIVASVATVSSVFHGSSPVQASSIQIDQVTTASPRDVKPPQLFFVKLKFDDSVFAMSVPPAEAGPDDVAMYVDAQEWARYGYPTPVVVDSVPGTTFERQSDLPHVYANIANRRIQLTFEQWERMGHPTPTVGGTQYVKYAWQDDIYAVTFFGANRGQWLWHKVTFDEWNRLGQPRARTAGWIEGSSYRLVPQQGGSQSDVYVTLNGVTHLLTFEEWVAAGQPLDPYESFPSV